MSKRVCRPRDSMTCTPANVPRGLLFTRWGCGPVYPTESGNHMMSCDCYMTKLTDNGEGKDEDQVNVQILPVS